MRNQYTSVTISGYNSSPPPDDASQTSANRVEWAKHKTKLADPIKTLAEDINTQVNAAFGKVPFYAKNSKAADYTAVQADDGKWIPFTATGDLTLASATSFGEGWTTLVHNENAVGFVGINHAATDKLNGATDAGTLMPGAAALLVGDGTDRFAALFGGNARITVKALTGTATTWSKTGVKQALVITQAGGAGGGSGDSVNNSSGGGGGGGACTIKFLTATGFATFATTEACRVASGGGGGSGSAGVGGGDSLFGATGICRATGGIGGGRAATGGGAAGGAGGNNNTSGDVNIGGGGGGAGYSGIDMCAMGGSSFFGGGAPGLDSIGADTAGAAARNYGGGGGGGHRESGDSAGGAGAAGIIYVIEWR